ncbi:MAG: 50S ribosomal protein L28 [Patescibacteria group bacterium]|jgi:large subunit ribosomal protein L28
MPNTCEITGKKTGNGNRRSHSKIATKRKFKVNLQKKKLINPTTGEKMTLNLSTKAIKTLKKWNEEGKKYDLEVLISK